MRYAVKGRRPGENYYFGTQRFATHAIDGGLTLTDEQRDLFEANDLPLERVSDIEPSDRVDIGQQVQDQAAEAAFHEAVAAGAAAGLYGDAPKTLKTFHDIARAQHGVSGTDIVAHAEAGDEIVPRNARRTLGDPVIVPGSSKGKAKAAVDGTAVDDGAGKSDDSAL